MIFSKECVKKILLSLITAIVIIVCCTNGKKAYSQRNNFINYSLENGLPQSTIYSIIQDQRGYLWLGMDGGGLCRFDGNKFKVFSQKNGFSGESVRVLLEDSKGRIWAGTKDEGVIVYDGYTFKNIGKNSGLVCNTVLSLVEDKNGSIWAGTDDAGLNKIIECGKDSFRVETIDENNGLSNNSVFNIYEDKEGHLWLATFGGINVVTFSKDSFQINQLRGGREIPSDFILSIAEDHYGTLWFGTLEEGVFSLDPPTSKSSSDFGLEILSRKVTVYNNLNGFNARKIWNIYLTNEKELWFASVDNGIVRKRNDKQKSDSTLVFEHYSVKEGLPGNQVLSIFQDNSGNIWIGTSGDGLCKFLGDKFSHYSEKDGLASNKVQGIDQDQEGSFWLATSGGGLVKAENLKSSPSFQAYTTKDGLLGNSILAVSAGKTETNKNIWAVVSDVGITKYNGKNFTNYTETHGLLDNSVYSILVDKNGIIWSGSKEGISRFDGVKFLTMDLEALQITGKDVNAIIQDQNGNLWFGTRGGIAKYSGTGEITTYDEVEGLFHKEVKSLVEGPNGNIWIGTNGGIYMFDINIEQTVKIRNIANDSLLSSNSIRSLIFDNDNNLIIGNDKGFDKIIFDKTGNGFIVKNYNVSDGFLGVECNDNAIYKDAEGNIWFGTVKGLTRYDASSEKQIANPPQTNITSIKLAYKDINWKTMSDSVSPWFNLPYNLELAYNENHLTFLVSAISLDNPDKVLYSYMLEGWEENWSPPTTQNERDYPVLPPGKYTFKVRAKGANGIWNSEPTTFSFKISPPWYKTIWFYTICVVLAIIIIFLFIWIREKNLIREKKILETKVKERTAEVVKQKEEIEQQKEVIEEKNKDITDSINYAKRIQQAILPESQRIKKALPESFIFFKPRDIVSGDFYWYSEVEENGEAIYIIAAADCTGHGVPGGFMSMLNSSLLNQAVNEKEIYTPSEILNDVRQGIISALKQTGEFGGQKDGMDIAIVSIRYKKNVPIIQYAGANNSLYIIHKNAETPFQEIGPDKMPVAISDRLHDFKNNVIELQRGDSFYIFTDGFADQFGGPSGKKFKYPKFKDLLMSSQDKSMEEQKLVLDAALNDWVGHINPYDNKPYEQIDDVLVIGVKL